MLWVVETISPILKVKLRQEILIQCQMRRVRRRLRPIKYWDPCMWGHLHRPRDFLLL
jgi:hypothetical protein